MRLSDLKTGQSATILKVLGHGGFRRRIMEMGFVRGKKVEVVLNAPLRDPIVYKIMDYEVSLRRSEAHMVVVITNEEAEGLISEEYNGTREGDQLHEVIAQSSKRINVALVGNPNSGKTSLFNAISGGHEHVGNYSGVTVDAKRGHCTYRGYRFEITDLPGTYALTAYSPEELYVRRHLAEHTPDVIINAVVASNLERNLYLTTELIDLNPRVVVALNMYDELEASGAELDYDSLGRMLGVPMVPVVARHGRGIEALLDTVIASGPDIIGHNIETVERLTPVVRSRAKYRTSLETLRCLNRQGVVTKSGLMVGLGESDDEVLQTLHDLRDAGVRIVTLGQYLRPTLEHYPVAAYITPEKFEWYRLKALEMGFSYCASAPLVRSSYMAEEALRSVKSL